MDYEPIGMVSAAPMSGDWFHQHFGVGRDPLRFIAWIPGRIMRAPKNRGVQELPRSFAPRSTYATVAAPFPTTKKIHKSGRTMNRRSRPSVRRRSWKTGATENPRKGKFGRTTISSALRAYSAEVDTGSAIRICSRDWFCANSFRSDDSIPSEIRAKRLAGGAAPIKGLPHLRPPTTKHLGRSLSPAARSACAATRREAGLCERSIILAIGTPTLAASAAGFRTDRFCRYAFGSGTRPTAHVC